MENIQLLIQISIFLQQKYLLYEPNINFCLKFQEESILLFQHFQSFSFFYKKMKIYKFL